MNSQERIPGTVMRPVHRAAESQFVVGTSRRRALPGSQSIRAAERGFVSVPAALARVAAAVDRVAMEGKSSFASSGRREQSQVRVAHGYTGPAPKRSASPQVPPTAASAPRRPRTALRVRLWFASKGFSVAAPGSFGAINTWSSGVRTTRPNPSVEGTRNGFGPRGAVVYPAPRGPKPLRAPHLKRSQFRTSIDLNSGGAARCSKDSD